MGKVGGNGGDVRSSATSSARPCRDAVHVEKPDGRGVIGVIRRQRRHFGGRRNEERLERAGGRVQGGGVRDGGVCVIYWVGEKLRAWLFREMPYM